VTRFRLPLAVAAVGLAGCSDSPVGPDEGGLSQLIVSEALHRPAEAITAGPASTLLVAYVSLPPGTLPGIVSVRIRNLTSTGTQGPIVPLVDGGFDPVAVPAVPGDRLEFQLTDGDGAVTEETTLVPIKRPPVVVRTSPVGGRTDVALSMRPEVVFSEPVDPSTLTVGMRLVTGGLVVSGRIELREPWLAELVPDVPLAPLTTYRLELTRDIRDLDGDPLQGAVTAEFTTHAGPPASLSRMRIAFVSSRDGTDRIYLANGDGSDVTPLTAGTGPAWSWDDQRIAFHRDTPDGAVIGIINADGTGEQVLGPGTHPAWSPDGRLAFVSLREDAGGIAVMNADGSGYSLLLSHDFTYPGCQPPTSIYAWWGDCVTDPHWSPDGQRIAFFSGDVGYTGAELYAMNADGSSPIQLVPDRIWSARQPTWAPDGSRLAFAWASSSISALSLDGSGTMSTLTRGVDPSWSPDGRWIAYLDDAGPLRIAATNVVTGEPYGQLIPEVPANPDYYDSSAEWGHTIR
jgi:Tol biopolymer transport system component